jgi:hypothetical protein
MQVLDLFCGKGGWSVPFIEDGDYVTGIDIEDVGYPGHFLQADVRSIHGVFYSGYDLIIGSPPCDEISKVSVAGNRHPQNMDLAFELIGEFHRIVKEARPALYAWENVERLRRFYPEKPILTFRMGAQARRCLWGNIPISLAPDFRYPNRILASRTGRYYAKRKGVKALSGRDFAMIPYEVARFIADSVKQELAPEPSSASSSAAASEGSR